MRYSIIVPVFEQWHMVPDLLASLARQTRQLTDVEVILVDNGSAHMSIPADLPPNASVRSCQTAGSYAARNMGANHASGAWLFFTDADCRPKADWLAAYEAKIVEISEQQILLAGPVDVVATGARPNPFEIYDMVRGIPQARYVGRGYAATANLAVPAHLFRQLGGFDGKRFSGGDAEFCRRAGDSGASITFVPGAAVDHPARGSWEELATKARRVKGGQLSAGPIRRRVIWYLATLVPPVRESVQLIRHTTFSLPYRLIAVAIQHALWLVQIVELLRLFRGRTPERR